MQQKKTFWELETFDKSVNTQIEETKRTYCYNTFQNHKFSMNKTWRTINETLARHKQCNELPTRFKFKCETLTDPQIIADSFNEYYWQ